MLWMLPLLSKQIFLWRKNIFLKYFLDNITDISRSKILRKIKQKHNINHVVFIEHALFNAKPCLLKLEILNLLVVSFVTTPVYKEWTKISLCSNQVSFRGSLVTNIIRITVVLRKQFKDSGITIYYLFTDKNLVLMLVNNLIELSL